MVLKFCYSVLNWPGQETESKVPAHFLGQLEIFQGPVVILVLFCEGGLWAPCVIDSSIPEEGKFPHKWSEKSTKILHYEPQKSVYWT